MTTLKEARDSGKLAKFIREHKGDAPGDAEALERGIKSMAGKPAAKPEKPE